MSILELVFFIFAPAAVLALIVFNLRDELAPAWRQAAIVAGITCAFFHRILFLGEALSQSDANLYQLQFFSVYREAILKFGEIPFWNPHIGAGVPNLANPLSAMFYPLAPVFLVFGVFRAMSIFVALHYFLAGTFALLLARRIFATGHAAVAFAVLYAFNGWAVTRAAHQPAIEYMFAYAWMPLAALAFERAVAGRSITVSIMTAGAALAWMGMTCPNVFVYGGLFMAVAFLVRLEGLVLSGRRNAAATAVTAAIGAAVFAFALGAVEYGPARELASFSQSGRLGEALPSGWRSRGLSPWETLRFFLPYSPGRPFGVYYSPGIAAVLLGIYAVYESLRHKFMRRLVVGCAILLGFAALIVCKSPLFGALTRVSDTFAVASLMPASLVLLVVPTALLAAAGVDAIIRERKRLSRWKAAAAPGIIVAELLMLFVVIYPTWGERRLTFKPQPEVSDFPHLNAIAIDGHPGRMATFSPGEAEILAPSYAVLSRGLSRLNPAFADFAPAWLTTAIDGATEPTALRALGVGWAVSTSPLQQFGPAMSINWESVNAHLEDNVFFPLRNVAAWAAWDDTVHLHRIDTAPAIVRVAPEGDAAMGTDRPLEDMATVELGRLSAWPGVRSEGTANTLYAAAGGVRCFFAVTAYPGWSLFAGGKRVATAPAAGAFISADLPEDVSTVELRFRPTKWTLSLSLAVAAWVFSIAVTARQLKAGTAGTASVTC